VPVSSCLPIAALCLGLCFPALAAAQSDATLLVKNDMACNWKLDGQPMDPLKANGSRVVPVLPDKHHIQAVSTDGVAKIHIEVESVKGQQMVEIWLKDEHDQELKRRQEEAIRKQVEADVARRGFSVLPNGRTFRGRFLSSASATTRGRRVCASRFNDVCD